MAEALSLGEQARDLFLALAHSLLISSANPVLLQLSPDQAFRLAKQAIEGLMQGEDVHKRCDQFEVMLQKLESEVRAHIRVEHQLKLQVEGLQERLEAVKRPEAQGEGFALGSPKPKFGSLEVMRSVGGRAEEKVNRLIDLVAKRQKTVLSLEAECGVLNTALEQKRTALGAAKKDFERAVREAQFCQAYSTKDLLRKAEPRSKRSDESPLTDRLVPLKGSTERKSSFSPYRSLSKVKSLAKIRTDGLFDLLKLQGRHGSGRRV